MINVKNKRFTLIELVTVITVLSILLAIVLVSLNNVKDKAVVASVTQNARIIQTSLDEYYLKYDNYPIAGNYDLRVGSPQKIDVDILVEEGILKKKLDYSKIKKQFFYIDNFGTVWGATETLPSISKIKNNEEYFFEVGFNKNHSGMRIYELKGYDKYANYKTQGLYADKKSVAKTTINKVNEFLFGKMENQKVSFKIPETDSIYLVSGIDSYGLELPPINTNQTKSIIEEPLLNKDGIYFYTIKNNKLMYWLGYSPSFDTPGDSKVIIEFQVLNKNGEYSELTEDFYSLEASREMKIKVTLVADDNGNSPSFYDLSVFYEEKQVEKQPPTKVMNEPSDVCVSGGRTTNYNTGLFHNGKPVIEFVYSVVVGEGEKLSHIEETNFKRLGFELLYKEYQYSYKNSPYIYVTNISELKDESCINIIYSVIGEGKVPPEIFPKTCDKDCIEVCTDCVVLNDTPSTGGNGGKNEGNEGNGEQPENPNEPIEEPEIVKEKDYGIGSLGNVSLPANTDGEMNYVYNTTAKLSAIDNPKTIRFSNQRIGDYGKFKVGDEIALYIANTKDINLTGTYAFYRIERIEGTNILHLDKEILSAFTVQTTQIVKVLEFDSLVIASNNTILPQPYDTRSGGFLAIKAKTEINLKGGHIDASASGYQSTHTNQPNVRGNNATGDITGPRACSRASGGGGSSQFAGGAGGVTTWDIGTTVPGGRNTTTYGSDIDPTLRLPFGGAGGNSTKMPYCGGVPQYGKTGGGVVYVSSPKISFASSSKIMADGEAYASSGGSGGGGSVFITTNELVKNTSTSISSVGGKNQAQSLQYGYLRSGNANQYGGGGGGGEDANGLYIAEVGKNATVNGGGTGGKGYGAGGGGGGNGFIFINSELQSVITNNTLPRITFH